MAHALHAADEQRRADDEADELRRQAMVLDNEAHQLAERAKQVRADAAALRAQAERIDNPSKAPKIVARARDRVRSDGLLASAGVAVEDLPYGFEAKELAVALGIADVARASRLLLALADMGKVIRAGEGWTVTDPEEARVRDFVVGAKSFTFADAMATLSDYGELELSAYFEDFKARGILAGAGGTFEYVEGEPHSAPRPRRRPPEADPPAYTEAPRRGEPVHVVNHGERGQKMAGAGKHRHKLREQRRERQEEAKRERAEAQARKERDQARAGRKRK